MTEWKNLPATKGEVYAVRKLVEELTILVKGMRDEKRTTGDPKMARMPLRSPELCESCLGSGFVIEDTIDGDTLAVQCACRRAS